MPSMSDPLLELPSAAGNQHGCTAYLLGIAVRVTKAHLLAATAHLHRYANIPDCKRGLSGGQDGLENGSQACAVLVGQKDMCLAVTDLLVARGVDKENILLNF